MKYKILWIDATTCKQPGTLFPHYKVESYDDGGWRDIVAWDFFESEPDKLKEAVQKWQEDYHRNVEIFSVIKKYSKGKIIMTEEDL